MVFTKVVEWLIDSFSKPGRKGRLIYLAAFLVMIFPVILVGYLDYEGTREHLTELTLSRREAVAHLAAVALREKFDRIVDVGISFATRVQFRKLIETGKWDEAIKILESAPKDFLYIDTVGLFDPLGTVMAVFPPIPEAIGQNFAYRDYYQGVSRDWQPYVSEVFKRAPEPRYNVVSVAIPIKSESIEGSDQKILGILLLTIKLDTILDWARGIEVGGEGFVYFVDRNGNVAGHSKFSPYDEVADFSSVPVVQKVLKGEKGIGVFYNPVEQEERLSAYERVPGYGWGVIVQEPTLTAFAARAASLRQILVVDGVILVIISLLAYLLLRFIITLNLYRQKEAVLLASIGDGLAAIDRSWNITLWNNAAAAITGWTKKEALGKPLRDFAKFVRERDRKENIAFIEEAMLFGKPKAMEDHTVLITKDKREIPVGDSASPIFDSRGQISGAIIIFRDISQEVESRMLRSDFAYASHQLRTPVNRALWGLEASLKEKDPQLLRESLMVAYNSLQSVHKLTGQLVAVSAIDQGMVLTKPTPVNLKDLLEGVAAALEKVAEEKRVTLRANAAQDIKEMTTDPKLAKTVLTEIIENAVFYNVPGGTVQVSATPQENGVLIEIEDSGIGILVEQQGLVFTKFFRGGNIPQDSVGAGLGLFISREYVRLLKGKIWFTSSERGTTFSVLLPVAP